MSFAEEFILRALERQQKAARSKGYYPTVASGKSGSKILSEPHIGALTDASTKLDDSNLGALKWKNQPGIARADLYSPHQGPKKLETVIERMVVAYGWKTNLSLAALGDNWAEVIGTENAQHCWVESFDKKTGTLRLGTASQVWAAQFRLLLPHLEAEITKYIGHGVVNQVIVLGPEATARRSGDKPL